MTKTLRWTAFAVAAAMAAASATSAMAQSPRDNVWSVGSSTVFPYSQAVAEEFGYNDEFASPSIESTGTGGGMRLFCGGLGLTYPDITRASRAMKQSEWENCQNNGVTDITELQIGSDGISLSVSRNGVAFDISRAQLFLALAAEVPHDGAIVANPNNRWSDIDASLPDVEIQVFGPPPTSGTRDAWIELVMEEGCESFSEIEALEEDRMEEICQRMRTDGKFIEAGENDNLIVQRLNADPTAYGIFGYSFLYENFSTLQAVTVGGVAPSQEAIGDGSYTISRPLFVYVKNGHRGVTPGLEEYLALYTNEDTFGPEGFLVERGLVALSDARRAEEQDEATGGVGMTRFTNN